MRDLDRKWFVSEKGKGKEDNRAPYLNKPYPITNGEKMTDILTHSVILQNIEPHLLLIDQLFISKDGAFHKELGSRKCIRILDIGTGHGYLAFAIAKIIEKANLLEKLSVIVKGIDIHKEAIEKCE